MKILYAEDGEDVRETIADLLREGGHMVEVVEDGQQLLDELAKGARPDLVLTDNSMPKVTGIEALRRIRADDRLKDIPVVVFAGGSDDMKELVERLGGVFFDKPGDLDELLEFLATKARGNP